MKEAVFKPVHSDDVSRAVAHVLANGVTGHFSLRGGEELTIKQLVQLIEKS